jgi:sirohydrochlorin cobaltochelatase
MNDGLLLVGHGTRSNAGRQEMLHLGTLVAAACPGIAVEVGFLELSAPPAGQGLDRLVARGATRVGVVPVMLNSAGHAKSDVPAVVLAGRRRHPGVNIGYGRPLGTDHALIRLAATRIQAAGGDQLPLLVIARGTSEPEANAEAYRVTRLIAEFSRPPLVQTGFSGLTWPLVPDALETVRQLGADRLVAFAWYLCTGRLIERMRQEFTLFTARCGVDVTFAGYLGPDPELVGVIMDRYDEAVNGGVAMNCDTCSYRRPFPGLEDRVGQSLGVGHSHLAVEHRALHDHRNGGRH